MTVTHTQHTKIVLTHERAAFVRETIDPAKMTDTKIALIKRDCSSGSKQVNHEVWAKHEQRCEARHHLAAHMAACSCRRQGAHISDELKRHALLV